MRAWEYKKEREGWWRVETVWWVRITWEERRNDYREDNWRGQTSLKEFWRGKTASKRKWMTIQWTQMRQDKGYLYWWRFWRSSQKEIKRAKSRRINSWRNWSNQLEGISLNPILTKHQITRVQKAWIHWEEIQVHACMRVITKRTSIPKVKETWTEFQRQSLHRYRGLRPSLVKGQRRPFLQKTRLLRSLKRLLKSY